MKKRLLAILGLLCVVLVTCSVFTLSVAAASDRCSLTIQYTAEETDALDEVTFRLYSIAKGNIPKYELMEPFAKKKESVDQSDWYNGESVANLADDLSAYIAGNNIVPHKTGITDQNGRLTFTGLEKGLYLAIGDELTKDGFIYTPQPILIWLPCSSPDGGIDYAPVCSPKHDMTPETETIDISAQKVWADDGDHPSSVTVQLLCDGNVYDEVTLSANNHWSYIWNDLEGSHDWQVREINVPTGYTVQVKKDRDTNTIRFTVTNIKPPQTGDNSNLELIIGVMLFSAIVLFVTTFFYYRDKNKIDRMIGT